MTVSAGVRSVCLVVALTLASAGCGKSSTSPSSNTPPAPTTQVAQASVSLGVFQIGIVSFRVDAAGTFSSRVDWLGGNTDIDTVLVRGRCTMEQILLESGTCSDAAAVVRDNTRNKPSTLSASLQPGEYTMVILNFGPGADTANYRFEGFISNVSLPATSPARRTDTFNFTIPAGSTSSVLAGSVRAGSGPLQVQLAFSGNFRILACVGTGVSCMPMGGPPATREFIVPDEIPAGTIQATVYFSPGSAQPAGAATGTVSITYNPLP